MFHFLMPETGINFVFDSEKETEVIWKKIDRQLQLFKKICIINNFYLKGTCLITLI
jgi:hypothetical protein